MKTSTLKNNGPRPRIFTFLFVGKGLLALLLLAFGLSVKAKNKPFFANKDYHHWADLDNAWINGDLNKNRSSYAEGDVVPHVFNPSGLVNGQAYSVIIEYDYYLSNKNAGGFVEFVLDPSRFSKSPPGYYGESDFPTANGAGTYAPYYATNAAIDLITPLADKTSGNTIVKVVQIDFTYTGNDGNAALYFGLRLAKKDDLPDFPNANGAAAWAGASLDTRLDPSSNPGSRTLTIQVGALNSSCETPPVVSAGSYGPLCSNGNPIKLNGTPSGGTWTGTGVSGNQTDGYTFDPSVGTQTLMYTYVDGNGCAASDGTTITVNNPPIVTMPVFDPVCANGGTIDLSGSGVSPAGGTWSGQGVKPDGKTFDPTGLSGTIQLSYTYTDGNSCSNTRTTTIVVNPPPSVSAGTYGPLCSTAAAIPLGGTPSGGAWTGTGVTGSVATGFKFDPAVSGAGMFTLTYTYKDANSCANTAQTNITVNPAATATISASSSSCVAGRAQITISYSYGGGATSATVSHNGSGSLGTPICASGSCTVVYTQGADEVGKKITFTVTTNDPAGPCDAVSKTVDGTLAVCGMYTYTQGYYGAGTGSNATSCNGTSQFASPKALLTVLLASPMTVGGNGGATAANVGSITFKAAKCDPLVSNSPNGVDAIYNAMPGSSSPKAFATGHKVDWCNTLASGSITYLSGGRINSVFLSQTIALSLNTRISSGLNSFAFQSGKYNMVTDPINSTCTATTKTTDPTKRKCYPLKQSVVDYLISINKGNVSGLLYVANLLLANQAIPTSPTGKAKPGIADVNFTVDAINRGFDQGRVFVRFDAGCGTVALGVANPALTQRDLQEATITSLTVSAFPNPFTDKVRFTIQAPSAGKATLEVYNMLGQKVGVPFEGNLSANETRNVEYAAPLNNRTNLIYMLRMNGKQVTGKLMSTKQ